MTTLYDEKAAGDYLGGGAHPISMRTLQRWRLEGLGPAFVKVGRAVRYRKEDLDDFIVSRTVTSTSELRAADVGNG